MTNVEYIFEFANKHNFPKTECEVVFNAVDDGSGRDIYTTDDDIKSVRFDKSLVKNEIKIEDIRFDIDTNLPEDVFNSWQNDNPEMSFRGWIAMGRYVPIVAKNAEFFDELDMLTKEIQMKLETIFPTYEDDGDSDYDDEDYFDDEDSDYYYGKEEDGEE
jgi:hypothetical protein